MRKEFIIGILLLMVLGGLNFADQSALFPAFLLIEKDLNITHAQMGAVASVCAISLGIGMLTFGYLSDKYSRKNLILIGCSISALFALLTYFAKSYNFLLFVRAIDGIGIGSLVPIGNAMAADWVSPKDRGKVYAWLGIIMGIGGGVGMFLSGMYAEKWGWRLIFLYIGIIEAFALMVFFFLLKEPERGEAEPELEEIIREKKVKYPYRIKLRDLKVVWEKRTNLYLILQSFPGAMVGGVFSAWAIPFLVEEVNLGTVAAATLFAMPIMIGLLFGRLTGGYLGDRLERKYRRGRIILIICGLSVGIVFGLIFLSQTLSGVPKVESLMDFTKLFSYVVHDRAAIITAVSLFSFSFFTQFCSPNMYAIIQNINLPETRGSINALNTSTDQVGNSIGPVFGGALAMALGLRNMLRVSFLLFVPCILLFALCFFTKVRDEDSTKKSLSERAKELTIKTTGT